MRYSFIVPACDPNRVTDSLCEELRRVIATLPDSGELLADFAHCDSLESAVLRGIEMAQGDLLILLDPRGLYAPEEALQLIPRLARADVVVGRRRRTGLAKLFERAARIPRWLLLGLDSPDPGCLLWVARREVFEGVSFRPRHVRYLASLVARRGFRVGSAYVQSRDALASSSRKNHAAWPSPISLLRAAWTAWRWQEPALRLSRGSLEIQSNLTEHEHSETEITTVRYPGTASVRPELQRRKSA
ncbi:MAG: hypothetical protein SGJ20_02800 [Planctomycetota bacterium]|nr:hypothetical protein [Planctomycetota bacterium]